MSRMVDKIYLHCSASTWGTENTINSWHKARRFLIYVIGGGHQISTGYHLVFGNGVPFSDKVYIDYLDGQIETARSFETQGAGVKGDNVTSLHFCLIGRPGEFTDSQMRKLFEVLAWHVRRGLPRSNILGHYEYWTQKGEKPAKKCPGIDMAKLRMDLEKYMRTGRINKTAHPDIEVIKTNMTKILDALTVLLGGNIE